MPYVYVRPKKGKVTSFYVKDKSIKVGSIMMGKDGGEIIKVKFTKRDVL